MVRNGFVRMGVADDDAAAAAVAAAAAAAESCMRRMTFEPNSHEEDANWKVDTARMAARRN